MKLWDEHSTTATATFITCQLCSCQFHCISTHTSRTITNNNQNEITATAAQKRYQAHAKYATLPKTLSCDPIFGSKMATACPVNGTTNPVLYNNNPVKTQESLIFLLSAAYQMSHLFHWASPQNDWQWSWPCHGSRDSFGWKKYEVTLHTSAKLSL